MSVNLAFVVLAMKNEAVSLRMLEKKGNKEAGW
jgi:hypothetical protein